MSSKRLNVVVLSLLICMLFLTIPLVSAQTPATWTVMVYMEADNNLEGDAIADILEMELIGSSENVNIVVQVDRAEGYAVGDSDWTDARRYYITKNNDFASIDDLVIQKFDSPETFTLASQIVGELGEINNGDPGTLVDFVVWATETYPAEKYALVMWNHGGTWVGGFGGDESTPDHDGINIPELDAALDLATEAMGQNFEFIGFDTCLMGQMEVFSTLSHYANYAAAAEELEPGFGWYYTPVMEGLVSNPGMDGGALAQTVVTGYMGFYDEIMPALAGEPFWMNYDQTAVDLSKMDNVRAAITTFSEVAQANAASIVSVIGDARNNAQVFGGSTPDETDPLASVDLIHFMELVIKLSDNVELDQAAQGVIDAVNDMVLLSRANDGLPGANGLSIFFPRNSRLYALNNNNARYADEISGMEAWRDFLDTFYGSAEAAAATTESSIRILDVYTGADVASILNPPTILFETNGQNIVEVSFSAILQIDDETQVMVDTSPLESITFTEDGEALTDYPDGVAEHQFTWGAEMPVITDGMVSVPTLLLDNGIENQAAVSGLYGYPNGQTIEAFLIFDLETSGVVTVWGINESENGGQPFDITVSPGDEFLPTWRFFDAEGNLEFIPSSDVLTFGTEPFTFDFAPADSGTYTLHLFMEDVAGNTYVTSTEITVDNEGLEPVLRGANDLNYGYSFQYPWDWAEPVDIELDGGGLQTVVGNAEETITLRFNFYDAESNDMMLETATGYLQDFGIETVYEAQAITLSGIDAYMTEYEFVTEDNIPYTGVVLSVYVAENKTGYVIDLEVADSVYDDGVAYLDVLAQSLSFFVPPVTSEAASADTQSVAAEPTTVVELLNELGLPVDEVNDLYADDGFTVDDIQVALDAGEFTLDEVREFLVFDFGLEG